MKILLTAVNAKYIHSNPAVYSLRAYAGETLAPYLEIAEYTINNKREEILADIFYRKPDVIAFSCYIWNWSMISGLLAELPKIMPDVHIWLGGPEVSFDPEELLGKYTMVQGIMVGEGEETFRELAEYYCDAGNRKELHEIDGIVYRSREESICESVVSTDTGSSSRSTIRRTSPRELTDISKLPFLYYDLEPFTNKIIYYESSRGCPYRCSYCLSSIDKKVRLRDIDIVKKELQFFLDNRVKQVKFVDRTFNCDHEHAKEIWKYLLERDNGITNFHFEIEADIISEEELAILAQMRPGLIQMEIGVQTFNPETLREIRRTSSSDKLRNVVEQIRSSHNIHIHLDLIAGLPYEDYESFRKSFNEVYSLRPQQLQLGFLKVLKGSYMHEKAPDYQLQYMDTPPYEVLCTKWLSYEKLLHLKKVEEMVELYYNSNQFTYTLPILETAFPNAFTMYHNLAVFYQKNGYALVTPSRSYRYQALLDYALTTNLRNNEEMLCQALTFDLYLRENIKSRPDFAKDLTPYKTHIRDFYGKEEKQRKYLPDHASYDSRQLSKMTHMEIFDYPVWESDISMRMKKSERPHMVLFDYKNRNALTYEAKYMIMEM